MPKNWLTLPKRTTTERFPDFAGVDSTNARGVFIMGELSNISSNVWITLPLQLQKCTRFGDSIIEGNYGAGACVHSWIICGGMLGLQNLIQ